MLQILALRFGEGMACGRGVVDVTTEQTAGYCLLFVFG